jgi:trehalose-6-phosphatase
MTPKKNARMAVLRALTSEKLTLATVAEIAGIPKSTAREILDRAQVDGSKGYVLDVAMPLIVTHYRKAGEQVAAEIARERATVAKNERMLSDIALAEKVGKVVSVDEMRRLLEACFVQFRETVRKLPGLTNEQKETVCAIVADMTLREDQ